MSNKTTIQVCVKCRTPQEPKEPRDQRSGARFMRALAAAAPDDVEIVPVECFNICKRPVTVGFAAPGKWTYLYGDFGAEAPGSIDEVVNAARAYAASADGFIPVDDRSTFLKGAIIARTPPAK
jgi:predicted metal-binding protein